MRIKSPCTEKEIRKLRVGDDVEIYGKIYTARDRAHKWLLDLMKESKKSEFELENCFIYHCGPLVKDNQIISAGPTTSARMNYIEPEIIQNYKIRGVIGKGSMDKRTQKAMQDVGAVYFLATGGAAALLAEKLSVIRAYKPEFGMVESIWELKAKGLPVIVTIDSQGNNLHEEIYNKSKRNLEKLLG